MTPDKLRYARHLLADRGRSIPSIQAELGGMPSSTLYHYLHPDGRLKQPGRELLGKGMEGAEAAVKTAAWRTDKCGPGDRSAGQAACGPPPPGAQQV